MGRKRILVVGAGSAGRRHARNFGALGCDVSVMDPRDDRRKQVMSETAIDGSFGSLSDALASSPPFDGSVIASPPKFHVDQTLECLDAGLPVYVEKPLAPTLDEARRLVRPSLGSNKPVLLGYTYRWWPPLVDLRALLAQHRAGPVRHVRIVASEHLADWHPWEMYQEFFMASKDLGGGALLDESHFLDLAIWLFGLPGQVSGTVEHATTLEIETDDQVDASLEYAGGPRITVHLDLFGRPHEKSITIVGDGGTIRWDLHASEQIRISGAKQGGWEGKAYAVERNDMFVSAAREFLEVLDGRRAPSCTVDDGLKVLRIVEAIRASSRSGRVVKV